MSEPRRRRRVFVTAGLSASAAVLAMAVQAGLDEPAPPGTSYGGAASGIDVPADVAEPEDE